VYVCPHCGSTWDDYRRQENIRETVRIARENNVPYAGWESTTEFKGIRGFNELGELYCCLPGTGLKDLVHDKLDADHRAKNGDENAKIVFINSKLGRPYSYDSGALESDKLRELVEDTYEELEVPSGALLVTVGVDVQHDRLAIVITAWGRGEENWIIYWGEIPASVTVVDTKDPAWTALEQLVFGAFKHQSGVSMYASALSIDSSDGQTNDAVYHWVRKCKKKYSRCNIMAIKGSSAKTDPEIFVTPSNKSIEHKNPNKQTKADKKGVKVYIVGTNKAKNWIEGQLKLWVKGIGKIHVYKGIRDDFFDQITGEVKAPHRSVPNRLVWQQRPGRAIEAWDCWQYALHAARAKRVHLLNATQWDALEMKITQADLFSEPKAQPIHHAVTKPVPAKTVITVNAKSSANGSGGLGDLASKLNG
jgi:phage terminase large subunit GpA-like protein